MNKLEVLKNIICIPILFSERKNISLKSLLEECSYGIYQSKISEDDIYDSLVGKKSLLKSWLYWSENKRSSSGWYLKSADDHKFIVAYYDSKLGHKNVVSYSDSFRACAAFIKKELDSVY